MPLIRPLRPARRAAALAAALATGLVLVPQGSQASGEAGAFLAARQASLMNDFAAAVPYLERLHGLDPQNAATLEALVVAAFSVGQFDVARVDAEALIALEPSNRAGSMVLLTEAFVAQDYARALDLVSTDAPIHPLVQGLAQAWAHLGAGRMSEALETLDRVAAIEGMEPFANYCRALALALVGDVEGALAVIEAEDSAVSGALNRRGYVTYAQLLGLSERYEEALTLIDTVFLGNVDPQVEQMRAAYEAGEARPFDVITSPAQGMAEVYAVMAGAMQNVQNTAEALFYAQGAVRVNPALTDNLLMIGQIYEQLDQPELAAAAYEAIPADDVFGNAGRMGRAQVLETLGRMPEAIAGLIQLAEENPDSYAAQTVLGDFLRRDGQAPEAVAAYTRAMAILGDNGLDPDWQLWFSRAVANERAGDWPAAEADFRAALAIVPDQPTVLNYLGYSLIERGEKLDEAMEMIERAVAGDPDSGYILDSLAWALYRLGRYDEAVPHMERAVEMAAVDPILNDHLGDVYWAVGRLREARFQWRRALSFAPADDLDEDRLRRKLEVGLDVVRAEAGEPPLHPDMANPTQ